MLEVKDLHKFYGTFHAVRGISFEVAKGEIVGFLGPNGAGKTTTMKIVTGYMAMTSGEVKVGGYDVTEDSIEVRRRIGYLPENSPLYDDLTVLEYLEFIADIRDIRGARRRARLEHVIDVCSLGRKRKAIIKTLSKGYRQRVGLAQAIIHEPELVILDEPTVGLDPNQIFEARDLIRQIGRDNTVILSSHILSEVEAICARVMIINDGKIVVAGAPADLENQMASAGRTMVSIRGEDGVLEAVRGLESVQTADIVNRVAPVCDLTVQAASQEAFAADLFRLTTSKNWVIEALHPEPPKLEDVFRALTGKKAPLTTTAFATATTTMLKTDGADQKEGASS